MIGLALVIPTRSISEVQWTYLEQVIEVCHQQEPRSSIRIIIIVDGPWQSGTVSAPTHPTSTIEIYYLGRNRGKAYCLTWAATFLSLHSIMTTDADFPYDLQGYQQHLNFINQQQSAAVFTIRQRSALSNIPQPGYCRRAVQALFRPLDRWLCHPIIDPQAGLKSFGPKGVAVLRQLRLKRFLADKELALRMIHQKLSVAQSSVLLRPNLQWSRWKLQVYLNELIDLASALLGSLKQISRYPYLLFYLFYLGLCALLLHQTFSFIGKNPMGEDLFSVGALVQSDFCSHLPIIRSFSWGDNLWNWEFPLLSGERMRYHAGFHWLTGIAEKMGLRLDLAFNGLSLLGLGLFLWFYGQLVSKLFSLPVAILSQLFFLFHGSMTWWYFAKKIHLTPLSWNWWKALTEQSHLYSFGPWDGGTISAFWSMNTYLNQRHFGFALGIIFFGLWSWRRPTLLPWHRPLQLLITLLLSIMHLPGLIFYGLCMAICWWQRPTERLTMFLMIPVAALGFYWVSMTSLEAGGTFSMMRWHFSYLIPQGITWWRYWWDNLGVHSILIPLGLLLAVKRSDQFKFSLPFLALALLGHSVVFGIDIASNHKFFNLSLIGLQVYSALTLTWMWQRWSDWRRLLPTMLLVLCILGGVQDFFPNLNQVQIMIPEQVDWTIYSTIKRLPPESKILNSKLCHDPAGLAGRSIFYGWPYFGWSQGLATAKREQFFRQLFETQDQQHFCQLLRKFNLSYLQARKISGDHNMPTIVPERYLPWSNQPVYWDEREQLGLWETAKLCRSFH